MPTTPYVSVVVEASHPDVPARECLHAIRTDTIGVYRIASIGFFTRLIPGDLVRATRGDTGELVARAMVEYAPGVTALVVTTGDDMDPTTLRQWWIDSGCIASENGLGLLVGVWPAGTAADRLQRHLKHELPDDAFLDVTDPQQRREILANSGLPPAPEAPTGDNSGRA